MRLRQIVNNLASNACKFTPSGGGIKLVTKLIYPVVPGFERSDTIDRSAARNIVNEDGERGSQLCSENAFEHQTSSPIRPSRKVHLETSETVGSGDTPSSVIRERPVSFWRRLSGRRRKQSHLDAIDEAEKGHVSEALETTKQATPLSRAQLIRHDSVDPNALDHIVVSRCLSLKAAHN